MEKIKSRIQNLDAKGSKCPVLEADTLKNYGLEDITLRPYQMDGVQWLAECYHKQHGCILADEMGLGKTCQTISFLVYLQGSGESHGPHLILSPLSVLVNWKTELYRFAPSLKVLTYVGMKEDRPKLQAKMKNESYNVVLTTYELCLKDESFLRKYPWHTLVVDEAHRLKNRQSLLHQALMQFDISHSMLLTGTPVQNNLRELYALLAFVAGGVFKDRYVDDFVEMFSNDANNVNTSSSSDMTELHDIIRPFLIRRIKSEVVKDLPKKTEVILYHGLSTIQKKYYKAILTKDFEAFENPNKTTKTRIMNILMQLRKCVDHPYLFDGVEPEPFMLGEHLVEASGKLVLLDQLLSYLQARGHKVLLFSQMTRVLDIIQDYLGYRGYMYERLDGSVRGEERYLAVQNFNEDDDTFIFLLSTKAGGQGLNLVAADTVIFLDSDFNPQNDLQAAARAHRIGQTRGVKVIRLVGRSTVEEIILKRATMKLKLTYDVIEGGQFSTTADKTSLIADENFQLQDILKYGVDKLFETEDSTIEDVDFEAMLGATKDGEWTEDAATPQSQLQSPIEAESLAEDMDTDTPTSNMYLFEGTDYSKELSTADKNAFDRLIAVEVAEIEEVASEGRALRRYNSTLLGELPETSTRKSRQPLTAEQIEERKLKRAETLARRAKEAEQLEMKRAQQKQKKKEQLWVKNHYTSLNITLDSEGEESGSDEEDQSEHKKAKPVVDFDQSDDEGGSGQKVDLGYLVGDVTDPQQTGDGDAIVLHCVDDSGRWGRGGIFTALSNLSQRPQDRYEFAAEMKDISLGDVHLVPLDDTDRPEKGLIYCGLIVAQHRDKKNNLSGIKMSALNEGLKKIYKAATSMKATVHLPRIGHNTPGFNWYGTERLLRKHLSSRGVATYIYYYPRRRQVKRKTSRRDSESDSESDTRTTSKVQRKNSDSNKSLKSRSPSPQPGTSKSTDNGKHRNKGSRTATSSGCMSGVCVHFHKVPQDVVHKYTHGLGAYDGDVEEFMSHTATHVVVCDDLPEDQQDELMSIVTDYRHTPVVTLTWLSDSLDQAKRLPTDEYLFG